MVTIIGGGIAGAPLAGALARRGEHVSLYDQQTARPGGGAFLVVAGPGHDALTALGVAEDILHEHSDPMTFLRHVTSTGQRSEMPGRGHRFWLRAALMEILADHVADSGAELHYDTPITGLTHDDHTVTLHHGGTTTTVTDDLIIAADGIDSVARACLEPSRTPVYAGDVVLYAMTTEPVDLPTDPFVLHFYAETELGGPQSTFGHFWRPGNDRVAWFARFPREPLTNGDALGVRPIDDWADTLLAATPHNQDLAHTFITHTEQVYVCNARNVPLDTAAEPTLPILLIGDADHAITPAAGVGARDALVDAHAVYQAHTSGASPAAAMAERRAQITTERDRVQRAMRRG